LVKKIRKLTKKGPRANYAIPMLIGMTCLYGIKREGRDFFNALESPEQLSLILSSHLGQEVVVGDRPVRKTEYLDWGFRAEPGKLAEMFAKSGIIPMGPSMGEEDLGDSPRLGILPLLTILKGRDLEGFLKANETSFSEIHRVSLEKIFYPAFNMIPSYDLFLFHGPLHAQRIKDIIASLNFQMETASKGIGGGGESLGLLPNFEGEKIPLFEAYSKDK